MGIVGRTGSGKSSITLSLFRIIELNRGKIFIDEVDISQVGLRKLRQSLVLIPQDPFLFQGSLKYNLDPLGLLDEEKLVNVLKLVQMEQYGIEYDVKEGGTNLSIGER